MKKPAEDLKNIVAFYEQADETGRLLTPMGRVEFERSKEIVKRHLPSPPAVVLDVGGASGRYSLWLAGEGYEVHLIDPVPRLVEEARRASRNQPGAAIKSLRVGDARDLDFADSTADAMLMFGPLYHLAEPEGRRKALREAHRVLKAGGLLFAAGISRFASAIDGLINGLIIDPEFAKIVKHDLTDGRHRNPTGNLNYFTDAFFHRPEELEAEIEAAGFQPLNLVAIDSFGYRIPNLEQYWNDAAQRQALLEILRRIESEPSLLGVGPHLMVVGQKPVFRRSKKK
jgi:ubiquinone/menaquinone biosynthesis C-methylase UbiE